MSTPLVLDRTTTDIAYETRHQARYIGDLNDGTLRVDLSSALTRRDKEDFYKIRVISSEAFVRLYALERISQNGGDSKDIEPGQVRYQLMNSAGRVIADSEPSSGEAYQRYQDLIGDKNVKLTRGMYTLRVSRSSTADSSANYAYDLTIRGNWQPLKLGAPDNSLRVYSTIEKPAPQSSFQQIPTGAGVSLPNIFSGSASGLFINTLA
jgi:hypothetical protein